MEISLLIFYEKRQPLSTPPPYIPIHALNALVCDGIALMTKGL